MLVEDRSSVDGYSPFILDIDRPHRSLSDPGVPDQTKYGRENEVSGTGMERSVV